jgi:hypothetical protein
MSRKILCLHGFTQNGPLFAKKTSAVRKALQKAGFELVYPTAPVKLEIADLPFDTPSLDSDDDGMRSWWPNSESNPGHYSLDAAFVAISKLIETEGPFDGVLGFSQGAGLAGVLCQHIHKLHPSQPELSFAVFYSGFKITRPEHQHFYASKITTPTLHIVGSLDTVVSEERSIWLYEVCEPSQRVLISHPGGHFVPNAKDMVNKVVQMIQHAIANKPSSLLVNHNRMPSDDWDVFEKIGQA